MIGTCVLPKQLFSLAHLTVMNCPPPEMTYLAARAGYDFVSLRIIPMGLPGEPRYELSKDRAMFRQTRAALAETGLQLLDIELARILSGVDVKTYVPAMEVAVELGCHHLITSGWSADQSLVLDKFSELCDLALPLGVTVNFEPVAFADFASLASVYDIVKTAGRPNGGVLIDALHFALTGTKIAELAEIPAGRFHLAQLCDARLPPGASHDEELAIARGKRLYLGEGDIDVAAIAAGLPHIPFSLEMPNAERAKSLGYEEYARLCLAGARQYFGG